jgi:hypothetical protein
VTIHRPMRSAGVRETNYRIMVLHQSVVLFSTVMNPKSLKHLLDVSGHLEAASFETWVGVIAVSPEPPEFMLDPLGSVLYQVTPTTDHTHGMELLH